MRAVLRTQLGASTRRPARLLLTGLAVLVVSFVVYATVLARQITENTLLDELGDTPAAVDIAVHGGWVTTGMLDKIAKTDGVAEAVGRVEGGGTLGDNYLQVRADPGAGPLALTTVTAGRYPRAPGEIAVTAKATDRIGVKVGDTVTLGLQPAENGKPAVTRRLTVVGTVTVHDDDGQTAYAPQADVSPLTGDNQLTQVDVRLAPGAAVGAVQERIAALVRAATPADQLKDNLAKTQTGASVRRAEAESKTSDLDAVFAVVGMFVAIAVVAAGLVAASTFRIVFAQRMRQLALLRAVGAGRAALAGSLAAEGALTGLATGVCGVLLAGGAGALLPAVLRATGHDVAGPGFPVRAALGTVLLAVVVTVLAVVSPAFSAARVSPLEALRGAATTGGRRDIGKLRWAAGLLLAAGAALVAWWVGGRLPGRDVTNYNPQPMLLGVVASGALAYLALLSLGPVLVRPVLAVAGWPIRRSGPVGRLAAGGVGGAPRRAAAVSVVVALGVTLTAGVLVGGASIRVLADREAAVSAPADFELSQTDSGKALPAAAVRQARTEPALRHVTPYRRLTGLRLPGIDDKVDASDLAVGSLPRLTALDVASGSLHKLGPGKIVLSAWAADTAGLKAGDTTTVTAGKHDVRLTVAAVLPDMAPLRTAMILDAADLTALGAPAAAYSGVLADAAAGGERGRADGRAALVKAGGGGYALDVLADERDQINSALDVVLAVALGLIGLTVLVAVVGVGATTALSVVERIREAGLLRAVGLARAGLRTMLTTEAGLYGAIGAVLGLALGVPYAWLAVAALGVRAPLTLPVAQLAAVFAVLVALTAIAGLLPARRAARVSPVVALGSE